RPRRALGFPAGGVAAAALVGGPWLVYSTAAGGTPLQGTLQRPGAMVQGGEPASFFVSLPIRSLVSHPYRDHLANQFLPQLHADLWSDWYGAFHRNWTVSSKADRASASSQSIVGLVGDALALGGLAAFGVPALWRLVRRRARAGTGGSPSDAALGLLALLAVAGIVGLLAQIIRYPQVDGKEIKASYLL